MCEEHAAQSEVGTSGRRYRNVSGLPLNRRVVMKAAAGLSAMVAAGVGVSSVTPPRPDDAAAQENGGSRAREWEHDRDARGRYKPDDDGWVQFEAEFVFQAIGVGWDKSVGLWPVIEVQVSDDGQTWSDIQHMMARTDDGGRPTPTGKYFSDLLFANMMSYIRYRPTDGQGNTSPVDGLVLTYIDSSDGPWNTDTQVTTMRRVSLVNEDTDIPPSIITRRQWGADESLRYDSNGEEIWPPEYEIVRHAIIHHAAADYPDGFTAVRNIYYYHCVTQGWGDIGYNYVVDNTGRIFEGRVGGQNVIGGHAYQYAIGSSGICIMGDYMFKDATEASKAALVNIVAFVTRDLNTYERKPFHEVPNLPTICGHRDVVQSSCPGDMLYADIPAIRDHVAATLDSGALDSGNSGGIVPGDRVKIVTDDGKPLNVRDGANSSRVIGSIPNGAYANVLSGPIATSSDNWYQVTYGSLTGWVTAYYLLVSPPAPPVDPSAYTFGTNIQTSTSSYLRSSYSTSSSIIATVPAGQWGFIMAGPITNSGYTWYQLRTENDGDGWMTTEGFRLAPVYNPSGKYAVDDIVEATSSIPIRVRPGIAQTVQGTAASGTDMRISAAPIAVTDQIWYGVYASSFGGGWAQENQLRLVSRGSDETGAGPVTAVGQRFRVTEAVNMRTGPGTTYPIVATLAAGISGKVVGGPRTGSGYSWWQVTTDAGQTGWVVSNWIERLATSTPPANKFTAGDTFRTELAVNMRTGPSTGDAVVAVLPTNTAGTITAGPKTGDGLIWYQVDTRYGTGWVVQDYIVRTGTAPQYDVRDGIVLTEAANIFAEPNGSARIVTNMPAGTWGYILSGPRMFGTVPMWPVVVSGSRGWIVQSAFTAGPRAEKGAAIENFDTLNLRSDAGTTASVVAVLPTGTWGIVNGGYRIASGQRWWRVMTWLGEGWVDERYIQRTSQITRFDRMKVTTRVAVRSQPNLSSTALGALDVGTYILTNETYQWGDGLMWWKIRAGALTGWVIDTRVQRVRRLDPGDVGVVVRDVIMRDSAAWTGRPIRRLALGERVIISDRTLTSNGVRWWYVQYGSTYGWVTEMNLRRQ